MIIYLHAVFGGTVNIKLDCPQCSKKIEENGIRIPFPNMEAEKAQDSYSEDEVAISCNSCGFKVEATVSNGFADCSIEFHNIGDNAGVECQLLSDEDEYFDQLLLDEQQDSRPITVFDSEIGCVKAILDSKNYTTNIANMVYRQLFSSVITIMEAYLLDSLVRTIFAHESNKKQFVKKYSEFRSMKFTLSEYYDIDLDKAIKASLSKIMFHNISLVSQLFRCAANIEFGDIKEVIKAVTIRHDLVHRNGRTKDGTLVSVGEWEVTKVIEDVVNLVNHINPQIEIHIIDPNSPF